ncbi:MAG: DUF3786 domain-containing protein [Desulfatiglandales bacterium]
MSNYEVLIRQNLSAAFNNGIDTLAARLPARKEGEALEFSAFGAACRVSPSAVLLKERPEKGPRGLVVSMYASSAHPDPVKLEPMVSFRDFQGSMPYQGAFAANSERPLVPHVPAIHATSQNILEVLGASHGELPHDTPGDFSLLLFPLPKIALCYIFYLPDDEFPASVTCLFSNNSRRFMPLDGLADTAEYTTRKLLDLISEAAT